ncbi:Beta-hexosaminidase [Stylophora pistillata]|uniref:beta-N-acetylhexosaminidase n=2 Tax=Stylophora pistillata TaxID=50429 RepID=A0A2B4RVL0_STYPI|nr:Beta-hexosaminidase [Stylophora pistillata]
MEPVNYNNPFSPAASLKCSIRALPLHLWSRHIISPNWYIASKGLEPRTIVSTANEDLPFVSTSDPLSNVRHSVDGPKDLGHAPLLVIPSPSKISRDENPQFMFINKEWTVSGDKGLQNELQFLSDKLGLKVSSSIDSSSKTILLTLAPVAFESNQDQSPSTANDSYSLEVGDSKELITITGQSSSGVFYGIQTLLALMNERGEVTAVSIKDSPRFSYRGLMVDVARNFKSKQDIMKVLDAMAMYKMNKFHFHLSDSEGWRLEIPGLEELTTIGSRRCFDLQEKKCIMTQLGSGVDTSTSGTGFYSTEDYREILRHAARRHIQVIPEFDLPGHSHAAVKSMRARFDRLVQEGKDKEANRFLLSDFNDKSSYTTIQGFSDDTVNPCINSTYTFLDFILSTLSRLHSDIQPLTFYHFGGDEVPNGAWVNSPECQKMGHRLTKRYLMDVFVEGVSRITRKHGLNIGGWSDSFSTVADGNMAIGLKKTIIKNENAVAYFWGANFEEETISRLLRGGYKVVLTPARFLYFDHSQEHDFNERGLNWAEKYTDIRKTFGYSPPGNQNILGLEGTMWGELIRTADQMHSMIFPRLLAAAERAWHKGSWEDLWGEERQKQLDEDWVNFANTLGHRELVRLDKIGVPYRVPPPVARIVCKAACNKLHVTTELPGLKVEYSKDDGLTWNDVTPETEVNERIKLRTRSADQNRFSRVINLDPSQGSSDNLPQ